MSATFDAGTMELTSAPTPVVEGVAVNASPYPRYSVSDSGDLLYQTSTAGAGYEFVWVTRSGQAKPVDPGYTFRITFSEYEDIRPFWTPDGQSVTYFSGEARSGDLAVWSRRADGTGDAVLVLHGPPFFAQGSWSSDGEWLVLRRAGTEAQGLGLRDLYGFRPGVDRSAVPLVASVEFAEAAPDARDRALSGRRRR